MIASKRFAPPGAAMRNTVIGDFSRLRVSAALGTRRSRFAGFARRGCGEASRPAPGSGRLV